jgi:hypothetical protein
MVHTNKMDALALDLDTHESRDWTLESMVQEKSNFPLTDFASKNSRGNSN